MGQRKYSSQQALFLLLFLFCLSLSFSVTLTCVQVGLFIIDNANYNTNGIAVPKVSHSYAGNVCFMKRIYYFLQSMGCSRYGRTRERNELAR